MGVDLVGVDFVRVDLVGLTQMEVIETEQNCDFQILPSFQHSKPSAAVLYG